MQDDLDLALTDAAGLLGSPPIEHLLALEFFRNYVVGKLTQICDGLGDEVPNWTGMVVTDREQMASHLQAMTAAILEAVAMGAEAADHLGSHLRVWMDQLVLNLIYSAVGPQGVTFLGVPWKLRADGVTLQLWVGAELWHERKASAGLARPGLIVPGKQ